MTAGCQEKVSHNCHQSGKIMISQCFDIKESAERLFRLNYPNIFNFFPIPQLKYIHQPSEFILSHAMLAPAGIDMCSLNYNSM